MSDSFGNVTTYVSFEVTYSSSVTLDVTSYIVVCCEFKSKIFVVVWTSDVIPADTVVAFPSTSGVCVAVWSSDVTTEAAVVAFSSTSGVFVAVWSSDVTTEAAVVASPSTL